MKETAPSKDEWKQLYAAAEQIKALAPWEEIEEDEIFGVQNPETGQIGFVSIMGNLGEHLSVAVYLGQQALYDFWRVQEQRVPPEHIIEVPQLQASFEDRNELSSTDRNIIKSLGLKYRGRQAWPMFRSYRPGFVPWYLTDSEVRYLTHALVQTKNVIERLDDTPDLLDPPDDITYLVRVPDTGTDDAISWTDQMMEIPPPKIPGQEISLNGGMLNAVRELKPSQMTLEVDFFMSPMQIQEKKDDRPYFAYMLMVVDHNSGMILGSETVGADPSFSEMLAQLPQNFLTILARNEIRPGEVQVQSERTYNYLLPLCQALEIKLNPAPHLPLLEQAKAGLLSFLAR